MTEKIAVKTSKPFRYSKQRDGLRTNIPKRIQDEMGIMEGDELAWEVWQTSQGKVMLIRLLKNRENCEE